MTTQRSRSGGTTPSDDQVAAYGAARAFLLGEWFGATLLVASFTLLYLLTFGTQASPATTYLTSGAVLVLGAVAYFRSRTYYNRIGTPYSTRLHMAAAVTAGSAGIFWLLFFLLVGLAWLGIPIQ